jgi:dTDP-4-amino-4,6-dideoxygalactose transaminase
VLNGKREEYIKKLNEERIDVGVHYRLNSRYKVYSHLKDSLDRAYEYEAQIISLPLHLRLTNFEVERVIETLTDLEN